MFENTIVLIRQKFQKKMITICLRVDLINMFEWKNETNSIFRYKNILRAVKLMKEFDFNYCW